MTYEDQIESEVEKRYPRCPQCGEELCSCIDEEYGIVRCVICACPICLTSQVEERLCEANIPY